MTKESWQYQKGQLWAGVIALVVLTCLLAFTKYARGEDFPPGDDQIVPLSTGDRAPFDGQLFSTDSALRWGFRLQTLRLRLDADVVAAVESCAVQTELLTTKLQLAEDRFTFDTSLLRDERDRLAAQVVALAQDVAEAQDTPWYRTIEFGIIIGVLGTALLTIGGAYLAGAV